MRAASHLAAEEVADSLHEVSSIITHVLHFALVFAYPTYFDLLTHFVRVLFARTCFTGGRGGRGGFGGGFGGDRGGRGGFGGKHLT